MKSRHASTGLVPVLSGILLILGAVAMRPHGLFNASATLSGFWSAVIVMGVGFALSWRLGSIPPLVFWTMAIGTRLILFSMEPGDDIWRYLWEGQNQLLGYSPYHLPPEAPALEFLRTSWWPKINHPEVTAIYPPLAQLLFRMLAAVQVSVPLFKSAFVAADLGTCLLLVRAFGCSRASLYAWNPLVIYCFSGGGHYDSWFILAVVAAWLLADDPNNDPQRRSWPWSALLIGVSVALKWISLPLLGFLIWDALRLGRLARAALTALLGMLPLALSAMAFCGDSSCPLIPTGSLFVTRGRNAEFIPHLVAQVWPATLQSNAIYGFALLVIVVWIARRSRNLNEFAQSYWPAMLMLSPIIHIWYFTWWIPFGVPSQAWAVRLVSLSGFFYFPIPATPPDWHLSTMQRMGLWVPPILGWLLSSHPWNRIPARSDLDGHG